MANRFWVGGTGTWDASDTTHWAATSNGAGGQSVPGTGDTVTFDGSSGGGTVTVNTTVAVQSITCGAFTGTLDFSANDNNVTLSTATGFSGTGSGTRTINLGDGTWTLNSGSWNLGTVTNLTFNANSSTIILAGNTSLQRNFSGGGLTYNNVSIGANTSGGIVAVSGANTFASLSVTGPNAVQFPNGTTQTVTTLSVTGTSGNAVFMTSNVFTTNATISCAAGTQTLAWAAPRSMTFSGGATFAATNSFDLGANSGVTITAPGGGGRAVQVNNPSLVA